MTSREMSLRMKIQAEGRQALSEISRVSRGVGELSDKAASFGRGLGKGAGLVFAPLRQAGKYSAVLGAGLLAAGVYAVKASSDMESLRLRLEALTATQKEAADAMAFAEQLSIATPFSPEQVVEADIALRSIGITGPRALRAVSDASALTGRDMQTVISSLATLNSESLRLMGGIGLKTDGDSMEFSFRDRMGRLQTVAAQGAENARQALLGIFETRFGGGADILSTTKAGLASTLQGVMKDAARTFGDGLDSQVKSVQRTLIDAVADLKPRLAEAGVRFGEIMEDALDIGKQLVADPEALRQTLGAAATFAARAFLEYLSLGKDVLLALARMMGAAFIGPLLDSGIPGMGFAKDAMIDTMVPIPALEPWKRLTPEEFSSHNKATMSAVAERERLANDPEAFQAALTARHSAAFSGAMQSLPDRFVQAGRNIGGIYSETIGASLPSSRIDWEERDRQKESERLAAERRARYDSVVGSARDFASQALAPVFNIASLVVHAPDTRSLQNELVRRAANPPAAYGY